MKLKLILLFFISAITVYGQATAPTARDILLKSDEIRNPQGTFIVDTQLKQFEGGKLKNTNNVTVHSRKGEKGQFLSIIYIQAPVADKGKILLRNGTSVWMFDPKTKASVRVSPKQQLMGNASNGDVLTSNFAYDYDVILEKEETIIDGNKKERSVWKLKMTAANDYSPYAMVELWVDKSNYHPVKGQFYGQSGKLLKAAWYRGWQTVLGAVRPTEVVIVDGFNTNIVTVMNMSNYRNYDLPKSWFSKEWLPNFTPVK